MSTGLSNYFDIDCTSNLFKLRVHWSETYDAKTNSSVVTISSIQFKSTGWYGYRYYPDGIIKINGTPVITMNSTSGGYSCTATSLNSWATINQAGGAAATGKTTVVHNDDGTKNVTIEVTGNRFSSCCFFTRDGESGGSGWGCSGSKNIALTTIETYILSTSPGAGSSISVNRTSSGYANTGIISSGDRLYYGDNLKITFSPNANYKLLKTTVNGESFTSGNTHTVAGDVSVVSTAQVLASSVGATDAAIGSVSTITVTRHNSIYYHSLQYSFGGITGYITSDGKAVSSEVKFRGTSVAFVIPESFYEQIPNSKSGTCTITCRTYPNMSSTNIIGDATTCKFVVSASYSSCAPIVAAFIEDSNDTTKALTGDAKTLIRYRSTAKCTMDVTCRNASTIGQISIAGETVTGTTSGDVTSATKLFSDVDKSAFLFSATDSRGHTTQTTILPTIVAYVALTCNPKITRPTPTGDTMIMSFTGNVYRGSFGAHSNTLTVQYRYKPEGGTYSEWKTVDPTNVIFGTSTYRSSGDIALPESFDYQKSYEFQVRATDGAAGYTLSTATSGVSVQRGVPVFDWGENDFNINVSLMLNNVNILDIIYPIGAVYIHTDNAIPSVISGVGEWSSIQTGIEGTYAWKRTA